MMHTLSNKLQVITLPQVIKLFSKVERFVKPSLYRQNSDFSEHFSENETKSCCSILISFLHFSKYLLQSVSYLAIQVQGYLTMLYLNIFLFHKLSKMRPKMRFSIASLSIIMPRRDLT